MATAVKDKKEMTLAELRKFEGQLFIQNNTPHRVTFHENFGKEQVDFDLDPAGDADSIAFLPKMALEMRGLQKLWMRKNVSVSSDPSMEDQIMLLNAKSIGVSNDRLNEVLGHTTDAANSKDLVEKLCLACGLRNKEGVVERGRVLQSPRQVKDGKPPLCNEHSGQEHMYVPRLVSEKGESRWEFDGVKLGDTVAAR